MLFRKNFSKISRIRGFMMVEIIVGISIIAVVVLAMMGVAQKSLALSRQSLHTAQASTLLEEGAEVVRLLRDNAWTNISDLTVGADYYPSYSGGVWSLSPTANTVGIFTRTVVVSDVNRDNSTDDIVSSGGTLDSGTKLITVTVSWAEGSTTITKTLQFYIADIFL